MALAQAIPILAADIVIDVTFTDCVGKASLVDPGGEDDEGAPARADITEFRADSDSNGLYLLEAWNDTGFNNNTGTGVTLRTAGGAYYRVYTAANDDPV